MSKKSIDCLIEVRASFYAPGDRADSRDLEEDVLWTGEGGEAISWEDVVKDVPPDAPEATEENIRCLEVDADVEFTSPAISFSYSLVTEGRTDDGASCGVAYETEMVGDDWFKDLREDLVQEALAARKRLEGKEALPTELSQSGKKTPVTSLCFLAALGYRVDEIRGWEYTEYESSIEYLGRVSLGDIAGILLARSTPKG